MSLLGWHFYHSLPAFLKGKHEKSRPSFEGLASKKDRVEKSKVIIHLLHWSPFLPFKVISLFFPFFFDRNAIAPVLKLVNVFLCF